MNVFDINEEMRALRELSQTVEFNEETGEVFDNTQELKDLLDGIELERDKKLDSIEYIKREISGAMALLKEEEERLAKKRKSLFNNVERLKELQSDLLQGEKVKTDKFSFSFRNSESVVVENWFIDQLEDKYKNIKIEPNKTELKKALKSGETFEGVEIVTKMSLGVR